MQSANTVSIAPNVSCVTCLSPSEHSARRLRRLLLVMERRGRGGPPLLRREHERPAAGVEKTRISIALWDGLSTVQGGPSPRGLGYVDSKFEVAFCY